MTPKEKAIELMDNFEDELMECDTYFLKTAKQRCALITVDEILKANVVWYKGSIPNKYWQKVKKEIQKL